MPAEPGRNGISFWAERHEVNRRTGALDKPLRSFHVGVPEIFDAVGMPEAKDQIYWQLPCTCSAPVDHRDHRGRQIFINEVLGDAYDSQAEHFLRGDVGVDGGEPLGNDDGER